MIWDKKRCMKCKFRGYLYGPTPTSMEQIENSSSDRIFCNYAQYSGKGTALKRQGADIVDTRGDNPKKCKLFEPGSKHRKSMINGVIKEVKNG